MTAEYARRRELAELVTDEVLGHIDRHHVFPLYTEMVIPTISGMIVEVREKVFTIFRSPALFISTTFLYRLFSMKGPFLTDLDIGSYLTSCA